MPGGTLGRPARPPQAGIAAERAKLYTVFPHPGSRQREQPNAMGRQARAARVQTCAPVSLSQGGNDLGSWLAGAAAGCSLAISPWCLPGDALPSSMHSPFKRGSPIHAA